MTIPAGHWYPRERVSTIKCPNGIGVFRAEKYPSGTVEYYSDSYWEKVQQSMQQSRYCGSVIMMTNTSFVVDIPSRQRISFKTLAEAEHHLTTITCESC